LDFDSLGVRAPNPTHYRFALLVYANSSLNCHEPETFLAAMLNSEQMGFTRRRSMCRLEALRRDCR
jgi:DNA polymerase III alpha subunit